jgi:hypothetical protein
LLAPRELTPAGLEHPSKTAGNAGRSGTRGTESGTLSADSGFADVLLALMRPPLTDAEKAEVARRVLLERKN